MRVWKLMAAAGVAAAALLTECQRTGSGRGGATASSGEATRIGPPHAAVEDSTPEGLLYRRGCIMCHGELGRGTQLGPSLAGLSADSILPVVMAGVAHPDSFPVPMPPRGDGTLTDDEVRSVSTYVASLSAR